MRASSPTIHHHIGQSVILHLEHYQVLANGVLSRLLKSNKMDSRSTTPTPFPTLQIQHAQTPTTDLQTALSPPKPPSPYGSLQWTQYLFRLSTLLTSAALLALTVFIAAKWGQEYPEKTYAVIMAGAAIAIITDLGTIYFLFARMSQTSTPVTIAVLDAVALVMCAVGIPTVRGIVFKTEYDTAVWALAVVVIVERAGSMATCLWDWVFIRRRRNEGTKSIIFKQEMGSTSESALAARRRRKHEEAAGQGAAMAGADAGASTGEFLQPVSARASLVGGGRPSLVLAGDMSGRASFPSIIVGGGGDDDRV
ncbi:hypothetical protein NEUTE1DRAFT_140249 [Neurospora tetrasperma FGSC 2508]|uniref:Uncharacterized protein n=1 Tax=Neurospora tetrasperma (strain FGSC 2508 / ATCC MYA-4615 / P0657) TaxID=510951 RepID=F8MV96_NEUT8|nr:uncharacterized protein NEUTE1DRAFT_140249 [Neurospora tetrasperma FGSC 2508]EGO53901.1 hypothetical protein NEUTE1DRAFT_140249 [Neurospora tetrasperma FGSC 2508]